MLIVVDYSSCNTQGVLTALLNACFNLIHFCFQVVEQLKGINQKRFDGIKLKRLGFIYSYSPFLYFCRCVEEGDECGRPPGRLPSTTTWVLQRRLAAKTACWSTLLCRRSHVLGLGDVLLPRNRTQRSVVA